MLLGSGKPEFSSYFDNKFLLQNLVGMVWICNDFEKKRTQITRKPKSLKKKNRVKKCQITQKRKRSKKNRVKIFMMTSQLYKNDVTKCQL